MNRKQDRSNFQPLSTNILKTETPSSLPHLPANCVTTRFVRTATNKQKCPVYQVLFLCRNVAGPKISFFHKKSENIWSGAWRLSSVQRLFLSQLMRVSQLWFLKNNRSIGTFYQQKIHFWNVVLKHDTSKEFEK